MAFKFNRQGGQNADTIESLFHDIRPKKVDALYAHQADVLNKYQSEKFFNSKNVALELPTGSGKTLIGLLIGEYHRRVKNHKVVFLCSTKQLVHQVVELANNKYGIKATAFTGKKNLYSPSDKADYATLKSIAVTTYSALFNVKPFFSDPDIILMDDAHVADNYIASNWSVNIDRHSLTELYKELLFKLRGGLEHFEYTRYNEDLIDPREINTVQLIPTHVIYSQHAQIIDLLNRSLNIEENGETYFPWSNVRDHLGSCQIYISWKSILIRPIVPPTLTIPAFENAKQRVYMSATLGSSGDLERSMGIKKIDKIPLPDGWDKRGWGRRFFVFPELGLNQDDQTKLFVEANKTFPRSLVVVPDGNTQSSMAQLVKEHLAYRVFDAGSIEKSKEEFIKSENSVAIVANRYEGIDFEGEQCRLLFIVNLSKTNNLHENFLSTRMGSEIVLHDRIRTRIIQAVGRCSRSSNDHSCVIIFGEELGHYFISKNFKKFFHPEIQSEITFGIDQSTDTSVDSIIENINIFKEQKEQWSQAENSIIAARNTFIQEHIPGSKALSQTSNNEVEFQYLMWHKDYVKAVAVAQLIINDLEGGKELNGYRGFWNYLAAVACYLAEKELSLKEFIEKSRHFLAQASLCSHSIAWLRKLSHANPLNFDRINNWDDELIANIESLEKVFTQAGVVTTKKFERDMKEIAEGLFQNDANKFEPAHRLLGEYLGFNSRKIETTGSPDPFWVSNGKLCIVFEDYTGSSTERIPLKKVRQAFCHPAWISEHVDPNLQIVSVLISDSIYYDSEASAFTDNVYFWKLSDFRMWVKKALSTIREVRNSFSPGNESWREFALETFSNAKLDPKSIYEVASKLPLRENLNA